MPWGRIDDSFYDHPKLDRLGPDRLPAIGLHWLAVSWCNRWLTDGVVTRDRVEKLGGSAALADALVVACLWERHPDGYLIHDFLEFNDSRADVEGRRRAERDKKRAQRNAGAGRAFATGSVTQNPSTGRFMSPQVSPGDSPGESRQVSPSTRPVPSRPIPSHLSVVENDDGRLPPPTPEEVEAARRTLSDPKAPKWDIRQAEFVLRRAS